MAGPARNGPRATDGSSPGIPKTDKNSSSYIRPPLVALGLLRATEAIAWTSIFPYVYSMIQSFPGIIETDIPFYAGQLVAVFTFCEFLSGMLWAKLSDRIGRKSALLIGSVCGMATSLTLGVSRSLGLAIVSRAFGGFFNPNIGLVQTCALELVADEKDRQAKSKAIAMIPIIRSIGNMIGPVVGGFLADPATLYPSLFQPESVWTRYPFLLPNLAVALLQAISFIVVCLYLPETHPQLADQSSLWFHVRQALGNLLGRQASETKSQYAPVPGGVEDASTQEAENARNEADGSAHELQDMPTEYDQPERQGEASPEQQEKKVFTPQVLLRIVSVSLLAFHKVSSDAIIPTFLAAPQTLSDSGHTRRDLQTPGGFGYSNQKVGIILLSQAIVSLAAYGTFISSFIGKVGPLMAYRVVLGIYPAMYIFTPLLPNLPPALSLIFVAFDLWIKVVLSSIGYICSALLLANVAPTKTLARENGASASFSFLARSVGPVVTGKILAVGLERGYAGMAFWTLGAVALLGTLVSIAMRERA